MSDDDKDDASPIMAAKEEVDLPAPDEWEMMAQLDPRTPLKIEDTPAPTVISMDQQRQDRARRTLSPRAQELLKSAHHASHMKPDLYSNYLVKGWIDRGTTSVVYGAGGVGKTFLALDFARAVSLGKRWNACRTQKARVFYIGPDSGMGLNNRVCVLDGDPDIWAVTCAVMFGVTANGVSSPDASAVIETLNHLSETCGEPFGLVIIDTLARTMLGRENSPEDMSAYLREAEKIRRASGAHVMIIHHTGKDEERGPRGSSTLIPFVEAAIRLEREDGIITAHNERQRDRASGDRFMYRLRPVVLGQDQDGDDVTSCVVEPVTLQDGLDRMAERSKAERVFLKLLRLMAEQGRRVNSGGGQTYAPTVFAAHPDAEGVTRHALRDAMERLLASGQIVNVETGRASKRRTHLEEAK